MNWKTSKYFAGAAVNVILCENDEHTTGTLLTDYDQNSEDNEMPEIKLENGKIVKGYECWWIPQDEVK